MMINPIPNFRTSPYTSMLMLLNCEHVLTSNVSLNKIMENHAQDQMKYSQK